MLATETDIKRATQRLKGLMMGISIDNKVTDSEIIHLSEWLNMHSYLHDKPPFDLVFKKIEQILEDNVITQDEREEVLEMCWMFDSESMIPKYATSAIRRLHGVLHGIAVDGKIQEHEVIGLQSWLDVHKHVKNYWPFNDLTQIVSEILEDGVVDKNEKTQLFDYCQNFSEILIEDPEICDRIYDEHFMQTLAPVLRPFTAICERDATITFPKHTFCFTGPARMGARTVLHDIVKGLGGIPKSNVTKSLSYLVIGAQSSPCWAYSTYGRKIEKVFEYKNKGSKTVILHEDEFVEQSGIKVENV